MIFLVASSKFPTFFSVDHFNVKSYVNVKPHIYTNTFVNNELFPVQPWSRSNTFQFHSSVQFSHPYIYY